MNALKLSSVSQQRMAIPLYPSSLPKRFSIRCRICSYHGRTRPEASGWIAGYDRLDPCIDECSAQPSGVERPIDEKLAACQLVDQHCRAGQIVGLSGQQAKVDQIAEPVGLRHDIGRYPTSRASDGLALSSPFVP
jgi:hypothetical protein